ncbi:MAG: class I tRNA ligase family protein [Micromonosporaceae bacterium]|nr:class I tRNA ligase family protein [Micromonosporaceae bacterium]
MRPYDHRAIEARWLPVWQELDPFRADRRAGGGRERRFLLDMFSYPSGDLHMGNAEALVFGDLLARYWFQRGYQVLHPVGWDAFGLPAENAAIRGGSHPAQWTYANIATQAASLRRYAVSVDWSRRLHTCDPEFYRWTQWLFLRLYERGLAYRKASWVNWCPGDQTVLANEQVVGGRCERCGAQVTRRELTQWFFRITAYAQRLLDDLAGLAGGWPESVLTMQRNWIGRSEGAFVDFPVTGQVTGRAEPVTVFTTRPDTLPDATFLAVAPEAALADEICAPEQAAALTAYREQTRRRTEIERLSTDLAKTGVFLGGYATNPATGRPVPVYAADYVLADYGTGAVMGVPGHDPRDEQFATGHGLPVTRTAGAGSAGATPAGATPAGGRPGVRYRLRDWLISRQRYWGCPIPIVHCGQCGEVAVLDDALPVELPDLRGSDLAPRGVSPLAAAKEWVSVDCPRCGGPARRDTDTMDTFVDSSWYFLRYCSPEYAGGPFDPAEVRRWLPVDQYVGGAEHATGHLLYARFITKVLHDLGWVEVSEPFTRLLTQGQVINQGASMSKSLGNGVDLAEQLDAYGVDAVRLALVFAGPPAEDIDWADISPVGAQRFLHRVLRLAGAVTAPPGGDPGTGDPAVRETTHRTVAEVTAHVEERRFNVAVARLMSLASTVRRAVDGGCGPADPAVREAVEALAVMLSLVAPYTAEEMWQRLGHPPTVALAGWPVADPELAEVRSVTCVVQVAGKLWDRIEVPPEVGEAELRELALASAAVREALAGRPVGRVVVRPPRLVNVVPG